MSTIIERYKKIKDNISSLNLLKPVTIIAVSKTFSINHINPLLKFGHNHYGENKVQEAFSKWKEIKKVSPDLKLHMIGKLQTNKAKDAVQMFDYVHSLDNQKLADVLSKHQISLNKKLQYFIQVNIGNEMQKSGIPVKELEPFYNYCTKEKSLNVIGLMIIPPNDDNAIKYFNSLNNLNKSLALEHLSMGMSADYIEAITNGSTFVRIGSSIFGPRS